MHYACQIIANRLSYEYSLRDRHCYLSDQNECNHEDGDRAKNVLHVLMETENVKYAEEVCLFCKNKAGYTAADASGSTFS